VRPRARTLTLSRKWEREAEGCGRRVLVLPFRERLKEATGRVRRLGVLAPLVLMAATGTSPAAPRAVPIQPLPLSGEVGAAAPGEGTARRSPADFAAALTDDTDVVLFPAARRPGPRPVVTVATRVHGTPSAVGAVLLEPARYRAALPSLVRADVVATRPGAAAGAGPERLLAWELEIPLFNLKGKAWLTRDGDAVELTLVEGAFAPGHVRFRLAPAEGGRSTILVTEAQVEPRSANWIFRRVARHDPWAETAMTAAAALVLARAVALEVESPHDGGRGPSRPDGPLAAPPAATLDGTRLASPVFASLREAGMVAVVHCTPRGRLAHVSTAVSVAAAPVDVSARVNAPESWTAFPGWKSVKRLPSASSPPPSNEARIAVEDNVAFVDLDATWEVAYAPSARATVVDGATKGAVLAWQVFPAAAPASRARAGAIAVLSEHPRLDESGYVARKMIEAEPLMEHALGLALTYADVAAMADRLDPDRAPSR